jgi:hypothetical protein
MEAFLSTLFRGTLWGAFMGAGMGTFSGILTKTMHKQPPPKTLQFKHPVTNEILELDTHDLDDDTGVVPLLRRVHQSLHVDPSIRVAAKRQFMVLLTRVYNFYTVLKLYMENPKSLQYKIKTRKCATAAAQCITNFEAYVWDSRELENIMNCLAAIQKAMIDKMLFLDK